MAVLPVVVVMMVGPLARPERQATVTVRAVVVMLMRPRSVPVSKRSVHGANASPETRTQSDDPDGGARELSALHTRNFM